MTREQAAHFEVLGIHLDGQREATLTIEPTASPVAGGALVTVRPKGSRTTYTLGIAEVAEMVAWRAAKKAQPRR